MLLAVLLLVVAVGLLVAALVTGHIVLAWGSVGVSVVVALALLIRQRRARLRSRGGADPAPAASARPTSRPHQPPDLSRSGEEDPGNEDPGEEDPGEEDTDAADLLVVWELTDEVLVVDEHPRYHLAHCQWPGSAHTERLPAREARELGFTPCARCRPDATLARQRRTSSTAHLRTSVDPEHRG